MASATTRFGAGPTRVMRSSAPMISAAFSALSKPMPGAVTSLATIRSRSFFASFSRARGVALASAEKPTSSVWRVARGPSASATPASRSGVGVRRSVISPSRRNFSAEGPPATRKSETAAVAMRASAGVVALPFGAAKSASFSAAPSASTLMARTMVTPSGSGTLTRAAIRVTSAPRSRAASASAIP